MYLGKWIIFFTKRKNKGKEEHQTLTLAAAMPPPLSTATHRTAELQPSGADLSRVSKPFTWSLAASSAPIRRLHRSVVRPSIFVSCRYEFIRSPSHAVAHRVPSIEVCEARVAQRSLSHAVAYQASPRRPVARSATSSHIERRPSKSAKPSHACTSVTLVAHEHPTRTTAPSPSTRNSTRVPAFSSLREADPSRALLRDSIASRASAYIVAESHVRAACRAFLHVRAACLSLELCCWESVTLRLGLIEQISR
uniref:Uncharacterized protein n=1 Tax=Cucumis melo TaxID=3656 RepID=A0A9I9E4I2_CUCME